MVVAVVQPTFLYELLWNVLVVIALVLIDRTFRIGHGRLFALYIAGDRLGRFFTRCCATTALPSPTTSRASDSTCSPRRSSTCWPSSTSSSRRRAASRVSRCTTRRAAELEEEGVAGYVDDWYEEDWDADEVDAATEVDADTVVDYGPG